MKTAVPALYCPAWDKRLKHVPLAAPASSARPTEPSQYFLLFHLSLTAPLPIHPDKQTCQADGRSSSSAAGAVTVSTCWGLSPHSFLLAERARAAEHLHPPAKSISYGDRHQSHRSTQPPTLSTMKSIPSAISGSRGPDAKFPRTIFFSIKAGISQKLKQKQEVTIFKHPGLQHWGASLFLSLHRLCALTSNEILKELQKQRDGKRGS